MASSTAGRGRAGYAREPGGVPPTGDTEHGEQLVIGLAAGVYTEPCADADRAAIESLLDASHDLGDLAGGRGLVRARARRQKRARGRAAPPCAPECGQR